MNKYQSQINKAKSIKPLQKVAKSLGVGIGNMKNIDKIKSKLTRELEKQQTQIKAEMETMRINRQNNQVNRYFTRVSEAEKRFLKSKIGVSWNHSVRNPHDIFCTLNNCICCVQHH